MQISEKMLLRSNAITESKIFFSLSKKISYIWNDAFLNPSKIMFNMKLGLKAKMYREYLGGYSENSTQKTLEKPRTA